MDRSLIFWIIVVAVVLFTVYRLRKSKRNRSQLRFLEKYRFHPAIEEKVHKKHPQLQKHELGLVMQSLRDYFQMCHLAGPQKMVSMPSQVVDDAWHEFILFTKAYDRFCQKALGRFLHHTPAEAMVSATVPKDGIKRAWRLACFLEEINPKAPSKLPRIFAIDGELGIAGGFHYVPNCSGSRKNEYCASHIACSSGCAGSFGGIGTDSDSSFWDFFDGDSCSGGDGCSSGCSGGCGGGD